jgi:hypothetical protein
MTDTERRSDPLEDTDWTEWYSDHRAWPVSRHVFLADAALRLGRVMFKPWEDRLLSLAGRSLVPLPRGLRWVGPERTPFQGGFQLDVDDIDIEAGLSRPSNWTDEEEEQLFEADGENNLREAARESARAIAVGLAKLAARGSIKTYARTISGGRLEEVQPADWEIDDPVSRLASCRLTPGDPGSPASAGTHLIFVESEALTKKLGAYARENPIALNSGGALPGDKAVGGENKRDVLVTQCETAMRSYLAKKPAKWTKEILKDQAEKSTGRRFSDGVLEEARRRLTDFPHIFEGGRPKEI